MAKDRFVDDLAVITGEELMNLLNHLHAALRTATVNSVNFQTSLAKRNDARDLAYEIEPVLEDAMLQVARIRVPMIEAQNIIWRAVFARRRPFRVNPQ